MGTMANNRRQKFLNTRLLSQSILNLLNNAADESLLQIEIKSSWDNTELLLEILDCGKGINKETAYRMGQAFLPISPIKVLASAYSWQMQTLNVLAGAFA